MNGKKNLMLDTSDWQISVESYIMMLQIAWISNSILPLWNYIYLGRNK